MKPFFNSKCPSFCQLRLGETCFARLVTVETAFKVFSYDAVWAEHQGQGSGTRIATTDHRHHNLPVPSGCTTCYAKNEGILNKGFRNFLVYHISLFFFFILLSLNICSITHFVRLSIYDFLFPCLSLFVTYLDPEFKKALFINSKVIYILLSELMIIKVSTMMSPLKLYSLLLFSLLCGK